MESIAAFLSLRMIRVEVNVELIQYSKWNILLFCSRQLMIDWHQLDKQNMEAG